MPLVTWTKPTAVAFTLHPVLLNCLHKTINTKEMAFFCVLIQTQANILLKPWYVRSVADRSITRAFRLILSSVSIFRLWCSDDPKYSFRLTYSAALTADWIATDYFNQKLGNGIPETAISITIKKLINQSVPKRHYSCISGDQDPICASVWENISHM